MKIAIVQSTLDARRGGAETSTLEMAACLAQLGPHVTLLGGDVSAELASQLAGRGEPRLTAAQVGPCVRKPAPRDFAAHVDAYVRAADFDVVHAVAPPCPSAHVYQPRGGTYRETIRRTLALVRPTWLRALKRVARRLNRRQQALLQLERELISRGACHVACVSEYVRRQVLDEFPDAAARTRVIFNGVDFRVLDEAEHRRLRGAARAAAGLTADEPAVLFVAHNFALKGLRELIHARAIAAASPGSPAWKLIVAGRDQPAAYEALARRLGVLDQIRFVGAGTPVTHWFAAADALLHPTWYDPCSRVVLEALACGLPTVTTRWNGAADAIQPDVHGEVLDSPDDARRLSRAVTRVLSPALRAACRADAPRFRERYSMARHARELLELYESILSRRT